MPLSEHEQRVLEQLERQLSSDDPKRASVLHGRSPRRARGWALGVIGALAGLGMLVGGVAAGWVWLGVLGFVTMFLAVLLAFSAPRARGPQGVVGKDGRPMPRPTAKASLLTRLEERWERRRDEQR